MPAVSADALVRRLMGRRVQRGVRKQWCEDPIASRGVARGFLARRLGSDPCGVKELVDVHQLGRMWSQAVVYVGNHWVETRLRAPAQPPESAAKHMAGEVSTCPHI